MKCNVEGCDEKVAYWFPRDSCPTCGHSRQWELCPEHFDSAYVNMLDRIDRQVTERTMKDRKVTCLSTAP